MVISDFPWKCPKRRLSLSTSVGHGTKSQQKSRINIPGNLEWHVQVAFVFTASRCLHEIVCFGLVFALNTRWKARSLGVKTH